MDPKDWDNFRKEAHRLLDACVDRMQGARDKPWIAMDDDARAALSPALPDAGRDTAGVVDTLIDDVMPYATGNTHARFFGWVHGTGMANSFLAEMTAAAMNSNCGGRNHGAIEVEKCVINWCKEIFDFPSDANGLLTVGTSQATILALSAARAKALGLDVRQNGIQDAPKMRVYCASGTHACVKKALQVMGHGNDALREIPNIGISGGMDIDALRAAIAKDTAKGIKPLAVVATAGAVNTGAFDDLEAIADLCAARDIWMHVDGAFGAWAAIAHDPWAKLANGIERADSIAFDFHKWMSVNYDCGAVLIRDGAHYYDSFAMRPAYLSVQDKGLGGGDIWPCDLGTDLSRGFRALKVWTALQEHGLQQFSGVITQNLEHAAYMAELVEGSNVITLAAPVVSNVCTFYASEMNGDEDARDAFNESIVHQLQLSGEAVFSTTIIEGRKVIRAAIVNHRTRFDDIKISIDAVERCIAAYGA